MMHYTELFTQLKSAGFNCGMFDDHVGRSGMSMVTSQPEYANPRIYLNGYDEKAKVYLFADANRRQNNFCNPISGYGLHVGLDIIDDAKSKMLKRCKLKHQVMTDLFERGFALKPVAEFRVIML